MEMSYGRLSPLLAELERNGELARERREGRTRLALTGRGQSELDGLMRETADEGLVLIEGMPSEQAALVRHVCVQALVNRQSREEEHSEGRSRGARPPASPVYDVAAWRLERDALNRLFVTGVREFAGPMGHRSVLAAETLLVLSMVYTALPGPAVQNALALPALWLYEAPEDDGIPRAELEEELGADGRRVLGQLAPAGLMESEATEPSGGHAGAAVCRLTENGRTMVGLRAASLEAEVDAAFEGVSLEDLAAARDGLWRMALNRRAAGVT